jgi:hypothetical protein
MGEEGGWTRRVQQQSTSEFKKEASKHSEFGGRCGRCDIGNKMNSNKGAATKNDRVPRKAPPRQQESRRGARAHAYRQGLACDEERAVVGPEQRPRPRRFVRLVHLPLQLEEGVRKLRLDRLAGRVRDVRAAAEGEGG